MSSSLSGKVVVVTGGGRGIGRAIALALADEGADICVTARSTDQIEAVSDEVRSRGRKAAAIALMLLTGRPSMR